MGQGILSLVSRVPLSRGESREGLVATFHPPIDNRLVSGLKKNFPGRPWAIQSINGITSYRDHYLPFIDECRKVAKDDGCLLIEVEFYWQWSGPDGSGSF
jgi:hypothetical protein